MKRVLRPALTVFLAAMLVAVTVFTLLSRGGDDARRHTEMVGLFDALAQAETSLDRDLLQVMAGLIPHYDSLVVHTNTLRQLFDRVDAARDWPDLPVEALDGYRRLIGVKLDTADQIKIAAAFARKEVSYLPFAVEDYAAAAPARALQVKNALLDLTLGEPDDEQVAIVVGGFAASAEPALRNIGLHMQELIRQRQALTEATQGYFAVDSRAALDQARARYMADFGERQDRAALLAGALQVLAVALFLALGVAISRLGRAHEKAEQAHTQLVDAVGSLQEAFALFDHGKRLVLSNARYDSLFPRHGRVENFRTLATVLRAHAEGENAVLDGATPQEVLLSDPADGRTHLFRSRPTAEGGCVCLFTDLTEHRRVEAQIRKLSTAVEQSPVAIVITDAEARMEYVNPRFVEMTGYAVDEVLGASPRMLKSGEVQPAVYEEMWRTITAGLTWRGELINRRKNGELYWEIAIISPIRDPSGRITNYVALKEDVTQHKRNADLLLDANTDMERMLFAASHDLQEPVRLMQTYCQKLDRQLPEGMAVEARDSMAFIVQAARQLGHLISGLAAYSRSGRPTDVFAPVECSAVLNRAVAECLARSEHQPPVVRIGPLPVVQGDSVLLVMLFENLIDNALKFRHPERTPEIAVSSRRDGAGWRIDVTDNGMGIEEQYLPSITHPFSRLHSRASHPGAGLGLASCVKIARAHGGRLWLDSEAGRGTVVHLWLPAAASAPPPLEATPPATELV